jgi:hypothetical protein
MEEPNFGSITGLDELNSYLDRYCLEFMVPECTMDVMVQTILNLPHQEIVRLSPEDCYAHAFKLHSYCISLRKDLDKALAKVEWCENILHKMVGERWKEFSDYMRYEPKRQLIISEDTFATKVDKLACQLKASNMQVERKLDHVKKMADILQDMGKRKSYDR